jgi:Arc/MetJ-type ribon-helix-helix transcriptional regulator
MTIHLPKDVERSIDAAVQNGSFASAEDALAAAWRAFNPTKPARSRGEKETRPAAAPKKKLLSEAEVLQRMLASGLITQLPNPALDIDDDADPPIVIQGEPLSETIIRERR